MCSKNHAVDSIQLKLITVSLLVIISTAELCTDTLPHIIVDCLRNRACRIFTTVTVSAELTYY